MMNALQGQLDEGVLANLLQYFSLNQASGCLTLRHPQGMQGEVYFEQGRVVHIRFNPLTDIDALSLLLTWRRGRFHFRAGVVPPEWSIASSLETLLLEASYRIDEARRERGARKIGPDSVLVARPVSETQSTVVMSLRALQILRQLDGVESLNLIARRVGLPVGDLLLAAEELLGQGLVEQVTAPLVARKFIDVLTRLTIDIMGPMGEIVVEDALYDLGFSSETLPVTALDELFSELERQFKREDWRLFFRAEAEHLRQAHGLAAP